MNNAMTIENGKYGGYSVYKFGIYNRNSVLAGQTFKQFIDNFDSIEEAQDAFPEADLGNREAHNHYDHL